MWREQKGGNKWRISIEMIVAVERMTRFLEMVMSN
jgi:hypothetical protein